MINFLLSNKESIFLIPKQFRPTDSKDVSSYQTLLRLVSFPKILPFEIGNKLSTFKWLLWKSNSRNVDLEILKDQKTCSRQKSRRYFAENKQSQQPHPTSSGNVSATRNQGSKEDEGSWRAKKWKMRVRKSMFADLNLVHKALKGAVVKEPYPDNKEVCWFSIR